MSRKTIALAILALTLSSGLVALQSFRSAAEPSAAGPAAADGAAALPCCAHEPAGLLAALPPAAAAAAVPADDPAAAGAAPTGAAAPGDGDEAAKPSLGGILDAEAAATGIIRGRVKLDGDVPALVPTAVKEDHKDRKICGAEIPNERFIIGEDGALANVFVSIEDTKTFPKPKPREVEITNDHCRFVPHITAAGIGSKVHFTSKDEGVLHSAQCASIGDPAMNMNIAIPNTTTKITKPLRRPTIVIVNCSTHSWMLAYLHVAAHDFFAVTGADGKFEIRGVPPGEHKLRIWHESHGLEAKVILPVKVEAGKTIEIEGKVTPPPARP